MSETNYVGTTINTKGIIKAMVEKSKTDGLKISQQEAHNAINLLKLVVADELSKGKKVQLTGFVSFSPSYREPRSGYNVATKKPREIPGCVVVHAKSGKVLRRVMRNLDEGLFEEIKNSKLSE